MEQSSQYNNHAAFSLPSYLANGGSAANVLPLPFSLASVGWVSEALPIALGVSSLTNLKSSGIVKRGDLGKRHDGW
jgi:hypothetical protein